MPPKRPQLKIEDPSVLKAMHVDPTVMSAGESGGAVLSVDAVPVAEAVAVRPKLSRANGGTMGHNEAEIIDIPGEDGITRRFYRKTTFVPETQASGRQIDDSGDEGASSNTQGFELLLQRLQLVLTPIVGYYPAFSAVGTNQFQTQIMPCSENLTSFIERFRIERPSGQEPVAASGDIMVAGVPIVEEDGVFDTEESITFAATGSFRETIPIVKGLAATIAIKSLLMQDGDNKSDNIMVYPSRVVAGEPDEDGKPTYKPASDCEWFAFGIDGEKVFDGQIVDEKVIAERVTNFQSVGKIVAQVKLSLTRSESRKSDRLSAEQRSEKREIIGRMLDVSEFAQLISDIQEKQDELRAVAEESLVISEDAATLTERFNENLRCVLDAALHHHLRRRLPRLDGDGILSGSDKASGIVAPSTTKFSVGCEPLFSPLIVSSPDCSRQGEPGTSRNVAAAAGSFMAIEEAREEARRNANTLQRRYV